MKTQGKQAPQTIEELMKEPTFPYNLPSHDEVKIRPNGEMWADGKPYMYIGAGSEPKGDYVWFMNAITLEKFEHRTERGGIKRLGVYLQGKLVNTYWVWPDDFLNSLQPYYWINKEQARRHGFNFKLPILLVHQYNDDWGLFRCSTGKFESIYMPEVIHG
jgi:hypothetical protein